MGNDRTWKTEGEREQGRLQDLYFQSIPLRALKPNSKYVKYGVIYYWFKLFINPALVCVKLSSCKLTEQKETDINSVSLQSNTWGHSLHLFQTPALIVLPSNLKRNIGVTMVMCNAGDIYLNPFRAELWDTRLIENNKIWAKSSPANLLWQIPSLGNFSMCIIRLNLDTFWLA